MVIGGHPHGLAPGAERLRSIGGVTLLGTAALLASLAASVLIVAGLWFVMVALLLAVPGFVILHRRPLAILAVWLVVLPLVEITSSGALRAVYWLVHRTLPMSALIVVVVASMLGINERRLARLGLAEVLMGGYVVATVVSIAYTSADITANLILLYDRVVVPMGLYLLVRLLEPDERELRSLIPAAVFLFGTQVAIALVSWTAPSVLPSEWLSKVGERTTGSLRNADVFGVTMLFCGLILVHTALSSRVRRAMRPLYLGAFVLALVMVFLTFSRAAWFAGIVAMVGIAFIHPRFVRRFLLVLVPLLVVALSFGFFDGQLRFAQQRLRSEQSEESALSRLPVAYAGLRMFEARPLAGWGYENFNRYDDPFQSRIGNLFYPDKDHSSHNLFITILAEQGLVGFVLFVSPFVLWLRRTRTRLQRMPVDGLISGKLVPVLWLVVASHFVINNFVRVQIAFGLAMWWVSLGLIASLLARSFPARPLSPDPDGAAGVEGRSVPT